MSDPTSNKKKSNVYKPIHMTRNPQKPTVFIKRGVTSKIGSIIQSKTMFKLENNNSKTTGYKLSDSCLVNISIL